MAGTAAGLSQGSSWEGDAASAGAVLECTIYKATRLQSDLVVKRMLRVQHDKLQTFHDYLKNPKDCKTWLLDRGCKLEPESADDIVPQHKVVRPPGTWTVTASVLPGSGQPVDLYCVSLTWPASWLATKGYSSFHMGLETKEEAAKVHACLQRLIHMQQMRASSSSRSEGQLLSRSHRPSADDALAAGGKGAGTLHKSASERPQRPRELAVSQSADEESVHTALGSPFKSASKRSFEEEEEWQDAQQSSDGEGSSGSGSSGEWDELDSRYASEEGSSSEAGTSDAQQPSERWVPYRHTNGVAIYFHRTKEEHGPSSGIMGSGSMCPSSSGSSEYMASSIVRGSPEECLAVLLDPASHTTILGPASRIEVLEGGQERQVLRLTVEATGMARRLCAPRELVVERLFKREDAGIVVVLFSSIDDAALQQLQQQRQQRSRGGGAWWPHSWYRPMRATVRGGYTISPRENAEGAPPECLVTCILKVDLGGACGECSWLRPLSDACGWVDAYVERMLMAVILVKDEVEQRRFLVQPFSMLGDEQRPRSRRRRHRRRLRQLDEGAEADRQLGGDDVAAVEGGRVGSSASLGGAAGDASVAWGGEVGGRDQRQHRGMMSARALRASSSSKKRATASSNGTAVSFLPHGTPATVHEGRSLMVKPGSLSTLEQRFWSELHAPGRPAPFKVRGASYLSDKQKVPAGVPEFVLSSVDLVITNKPIQHISRFLPSVRQNGAPFSFVVNLIIPGTPVLSLVGVFSNENHPSILGPAPPGAQSSGWQPFDHVLHRFLNAPDAERNVMFKLIPHIADGSWVIKQSVGTVPLIVGTKLQTVYHSMPTYFEISIDVSSSSAAAYITGMVRGTTKSLVIDIGFLLEGQSEGELPESLIGAFRLHHLDLAFAKPLDTSKELPLPPGPPPPVLIAAGVADADGAVPRSMTAHSRNRSAASLDDLMPSSAAITPVQLTPAPSASRTSEGPASTSKAVTPPDSHTPTGGRTPAGARTPMGRISPVPPATSSSGGLAAATSSPGGMPAANGAAAVPSSSGSGTGANGHALQRGTSSGARPVHRRTSSGSEGVRGLGSSPTTAKAGGILSPSASTGDLNKMTAAAFLARAQANIPSTGAAVTSQQGGASRDGRVSSSGASSGAGPAAAGAVAAGPRPQLLQLRQRLSLESTLASAAVAAAAVASNVLPSPLASSSPNAASAGGGSTLPKHARRHSRHRSMGSAFDHPKLTASAQLRLAEASLRVGLGSAGGGAAAAAEQQQADGAVGQRRSHGVIGDV